MNSTHLTLVSRCRLRAAALGGLLAGCLILGRATQAQESPLSEHRQSARSLGTLHFREASLTPKLMAADKAPLRWHPELRPTPGGLPVSPGQAALARERMRASGTTPSISISGGAIALADLEPSPPPITTFTAVEDDGTAAVPDTSGAVGPDHVVTVLNSQVRIQNRTGGVVASLTLDAFFANFGSDIFTYDPRCLYDPYGGRWIITAGANPASLDAGIVLAVSATSDPAGDWYRFYLDVDNTNQLFADSPTVGFNRKWIGIQANLFNQFSGDFASSQILAVDRTNVYAGGEGFFARFPLNGDDYGGSQIPATTMDPDLNELYFVKNWAGNIRDAQSGVSEGWLRVFVLSGTLGGEVLTPGSFITTGVETQTPPFIWADFSDGGKDLGKQNGTTNRIQLGDSRIQSVVYRGGTLWCSQTVLLPATAPSRSAVQWWEIYPDGRLFQRHLLDDSSGAWSYAYPSLAVNNHYDVLLGYNAFSAAVYPSAYYRLYPNEGIYNNPRSERILRSGRGSYFEPYQGSNRWGDWSAACVDPLNDGVFWTLQESAIEPHADDAGRWEVSWASIAPAYDLQLRLSPSTNGVTVGQDLAWTLTLSNRVLSFAYQAEVMLPLPVGFTGESLTAKTGSAVVTNGVLIWSLPRVGVETNQCIWTGHASGSATQLVAQASVKAIGFDNVLTNDTAKAVVAMVDRPPVTPPILQATATSSGWSLEWPVGYLGFRLESAPNLNASTWTTVPQIPSPTGTVQRVEFSANAEARFFRLRR